MKKIFAFITLMILFSSTGFAMKFEQPIKIGKIMYPPDGDMVIDNATYTSNKPNGKFQNFNTYPYDTVARFNTGEDSIYVHHIPDYNVPPRFGDENINNSIPIKTGLYGVYIFQLKNDSNIKFYLLRTEEADAGFVNWICIGKRDNKWIKYFDINEVKKTYFGNKNERRYFFSNNSYGKTYCKNDTIIIEYYHYENNINKNGEFRFKWDDKAQWFGVEQVVY